LASVRISSFENLPSPSCRSSDRVERRDLAVVAVGSSTCSCRIHEPVGHHRRGFISNARP
jgi:hypothetical protein